MQLAGRNDNPICGTGLPGYIGWRNRFLGINSWAPLQIRALYSKLHAHHSLWCCRLPMIDGLNIGGSTTNSMANIPELR
jgi:hypothetical protein